MDWPEPNTGAKADVDLGSGHTLTWSRVGEEIVGGIIRHACPLSEKCPEGYCEAMFWLKNNSFVAAHKPNSPQWTFTGSFNEPTLSPSFLCTCGDHGYVKKGRWEKA